MSETQSTKLGRLLVAGVAVLAVVAVIGVALWRRSDPSPGAAGGPTGAPGSAETTLSSADGTTVSGVPEVPTVAMATLDSAPAPSISVEVLDPAALRAALQQNPWVREVLDKPLGRGFLGTWAAFLGTRGEDMKADCSGLVLDLILERVLDRPFAVIWFSGGKVTGVPALVVPDPSAAAKAAFTALDAVASRGTFTVARCLEEGAEGTAREVSDVTISRWLLADHAVYGAQAGERMVLGRHPSSVLQGLCATLPELAPKPGVVLEVALAAEAISRDAQLLDAFLGLAGTPRLSFGLEQGTLVPRGILAEVVTAGRLGAGKLDKQLLRVVPVEAPVGLALQLALPKQLDQESLTAYLGGTQAALVPRQVALVWYPNGDRGHGTELGLVWSGAADRDALAGMFTGLRALAGTPCDQVVLVSSEAMEQRLTAACKGSLPSLLHASEGVAKGWQRPMSVGLGLHLGQLLSRLTLEAYAREHRGALPPEMQEVKAQLEALPFLGLSGLVEGSKLVPGGFRS